MKNKKQFVEIDWDRQMLGKHPDKSIANFLRVPVHVVRTERERRNIAAYKSNPNPSRAPLSTSGDAIS